MPEGKKPDDANTVYENVGKAAAQQLIQKFKHELKGVTPLTRSTNLAGLKKAKVFP